MFKPVDLQTIMPRTVDVQRIQHAHNSRSVTEQQDLSREFLKTSQELQEQIQQSRASEEGPRVRDEADNQEKQKRRQKRRNPDGKNAPPPEEAKIETECGRHIDIKI